jgi:hypothetical protein
MAWITVVLDWLNRYANLLLAIITAIYVYLTWKTLKALERSNLKDREAQHLTDIKTQVVSPILQWLEISVLERLRGRGQYGDPAMIMGGLQHCSQASQYIQRQIYPANLLIDGFSPDLYAASQHFPQLRKYNALRAMMEQLLGAFAEFGNKCCVDIRQLTPLPPYTGDRSKDLIDCEGIVLFFLRETIAGVEPKFYIAAEHTGSTIVTSAYSSEVLARGPDEEIRHWLEKSREVIEKRWSDSRLRERIQRTLDDAEKLRDSIRQVELTYALSGRCKYIAD